MGRVAPLLRHREPETGESPVQGDGGKNIPEPPTESAFAPVGSDARGALQPQTIGS